MQDIYYHETDQISLTTKETYYGITLVPAKYHPFMFLKTKAAINESQYSIKIKFILLTHFHAEQLIFGRYPSHVDQKTATMFYN